MLFLMAMPCIWAFVVIFGGVMTPPYIIGLGLSSVAMYIHANFSLLQEYSKL